MSKKNGNKEDSKVTWKGFVNWEPTKSDKEQIKKNVPNLTQFEKGLGDLIERGYKVSLSWDSYGDCPMVSVTGSAAYCANAGYTITQRHSDMRVAFAAAWYFIVTVSDWGRWPSRDEEQLAFDW